MSDFGAMISIRKKDGSAFSDEEETFVRNNVLEGHEAAKHLTDALGNPYSFDTGVTQRLEDPDFYEMNVLLSDYWGNRHDHDKYSQHDEKGMASVASDLSERLGDKYVLEAKFEWW